MSRSFIERREGLDTIIEWRDKNKKLREEKHTYRMGGLVIKIKTIFYDGYEMPFVIKRTDFINKTHTYTRVGKYKHRFRLHGNVLHSDTKPALVKGGTCAWYTDGEFIRSECDGTTVTRAGDLWMRCSQNLTTYHYSLHGVHSIYQCTYHREDGPAYISPDAEKWYRHGKLHREDGPAIISGDKKEWYIDGELHREDGPASISKDEEKWYAYGKLHRVGGPAHISTQKAYNLEEWYVCGKLHREDGPASIVITAAGTITKQWYIDGKLHRAGGKPAYVEKKNGAPICKKWSEFGANVAGFPACVSYERRVAVWGKGPQPNTYDLFVKIEHLEKKLAKATAMIEHLMYAPGGPGYQAAALEFNSLKT